MRVEQKLLWEEIQDKKHKLDELINENSSIKNKIILENSQELDELIKKFYDSYNNKIPPMT